MGQFASPPPSFVLPHAPIPLSVFLIVEDAIRLAWNRLHSIDDFDLTNADEDSITLKLHEVLTDEIYNTGVVEGFDDSVLETPSREPKIRNYNNVHPDKMPDIHIAIIGRSNIKRSQDGVFIECKPIDRKHTAGVHYCHEGIIRFTRGDYAWALTTALMVGYASEGYTVIPKLTDALNRPTRIKTIDLPQIKEFMIPFIASEPTHSSTHQRDFTYVETGANAADITIRHLWLRV